MKQIERVPLARLEILQGKSAHLTPSKRSIKITNQKFPADFFLQEDKIMSSKGILRQPQIGQDIRLSMQMSPLKIRQMSTAMVCRHTTKKESDE